MAWTNESKNSGSYTNESKNSQAFTNYLRHGKEPNMGQLADYTFESVAFIDGTVMENVTFGELGDAIYTNETKHT